MLIRKIILSTAILSFALLFQECKKGDGDPQFSIKSRTGRLLGKWIVTKFTQDSNHSDSDQGVLVTTHTITDINGSGISINEIITPAGGTVSTSLASGQVNSFTYEFVKDNSFKHKEELSGVTKTTTQNISGVTITTTTSENTTIEFSGTWNFLGAEGNVYKNKERILLNITSSSTITSTTTTVTFMGSSNTTTSSHTENSTYDNGQMAIVWHLSKLDTKEMLADGFSDGFGSYSSGQNNNSQSSVWFDKNTTNYTLTKK